MEISSGWHISFTAKEKQEQDDLIAFLAENDYPPAPEGIKELLMDIVYDKEKPSSNKILDAINQNPEAVQEALRGIGKMAGSILNKKIFKK